MSIEHYPGTPHLDREKGKQEGEKALRELLPKLKEIAGTELDLIQEKDLEMLVERLKEVDDLMGDGLSSLYEAVLQVKYVRSKEMAESPEKAMKELRDIVSEYETYLSGAF